MSWLKDLFRVKDPIKSVADVVDRFTESKDEKREFFKDVWELQAKDRANARQLYGIDGIMQKLYAATFLAGYLCLSAWLIYAIITGQIKEVNQFETGLIGSIWGAMTSKVNTIKDFFFGASDNKK